MGSVDRRVARYDRTSNHMELAGQITFHLPASLAAVTVTFVQHLRFRYPPLVSILVDNPALFQTNVWLSITVPTATVASFPNKEPKKDVPIHTMFCCIRHRTQQVFTKILGVSRLVTITDTVTNLLHFLAMFSIKRVNQGDQVLVFKHQFRHLCFYTKNKKTNQFLRFPNKV